jgi:hypothetical protein
MSTCCGLTAIVTPHSRVGHIRCGQLGRDFWLWPTREWADLLHPEQLRQRFPGQVGMQARPYLLAYAYLLTGFNAFHQIGSFARVPLAQRVFGADAVAQAIEPVRAVLHGWGYQAHDLESMVCTLLLLNRSPLLSDLSSSVLDQLRGRPAIERHFHGRHLHGVCRALGGALARDLDAGGGHAGHLPRRPGQDRALADG